MNKKLIKHNTQIAIGLLASSIPNRYCHGKINRAHRIYIIQTVTDLLETVLMEIEENDNTIIPKNPDNLNPPDET